MRQGDRFSSVVSIIKTKFIQGSGRRIPTRIEVFGLTYQLSQPINVQNYELKGSALYGQAKEQQPGKRKRTAD